MDFERGGLCSRKSIPFGENHTAEGWGETLGREEKRRDRQPMVENLM